VWRGEGIRQTLADHVVAEKAARLYGMGDTHVEYAGGCEGENPLYVVESGDKRCTLRLYSEEYDLDRIRSERALLDSLAGAGLGVPVAVATAAGDVIARLEWPEHPTRRHAVLCPWIEGTPVQLVPAAERTDAFIADLGEFVGRLHERGAGFKAPPWFVADRKDDDSVARAAAAAGTDEARDLAPRVVSLLDEISEEGPASGMLHGDLTSLNTLYDGAAFTAIDWGGFGWGYFARDLALMCRAGVHESQHAAFFEGYGRVQPIAQRVLANIDTLVHASRIRLL